MMDRREFCKKIGLVSASLGITKSESKETTEKETQRWELKPGDIIVLECPDYMCGELGNHARKCLTSTFPDNDILILEGGNKLKIIHKETS